MSVRDADWAVRQYEAVRNVLPKANMPDSSRRVDHLGDLAEHFDVFLLDAFGVLNVGETAIDGAVERVAALQSMGKRVIVVTNGATVPAERSRQKYTAFGFDFALEDVVSSRDALDLALAERSEPGFWGAMAAQGSQLDQLQRPCRPLLDQREVYDAACGIVLLSTTDWSDPQQRLLHDSLQQNPRPLLVGNPDIVAPREWGLSLEPGYFAHELARNLDVEPEFFGKPFGNVYDLALSRLGGVDASRIVMVGDTLHTDILGGAAAGIKTALITDHGLFAGHDSADYIRQTGIVPDFIMPNP